MKTFVIRTFALNILILVFTTMLCNASIEYNIDDTNIQKINIIVGIEPISDSSNCYSFETQNKNEIRYLIHYINSLELIDDGKNISGSDTPIININLVYKDGTVKKLGFVIFRFYDENVNKQYAVSNNGEFNILRLAYALKNKSFNIMDNNIGFEPSEWAKQYIEQAINSNIVPKVNQINYTGNINRQEVCQLIYNYIYDEYPKESLNNYILDPMIEALYDLGIINGKTNSEFAAYDYITREEFAKILSRTYSYLHKYDAQNSDLTYLDKDSISSYAVDDVKKVTQLGLMNGNENNEFEPQKTITKEEVIVTLLRMSELK